MLFRSKGSMEDILTEKTLDSENGAKIGREHDTDDEAYNCESEDKDGDYSRATEAEIDDMEDTRRKTTRWRTEDIGGQGQDKCEAAIMLKATRWRIGKVNEYENNMPRIGETQELNDLDSDTMRNKETGLNKNIDPGKKDNTMSAADEDDMITIAEEIGRAHV